MTANLKNLRGSPDCLKVDSTESGFTMIELIVAVLIITITLIPFTYFFVAGIQVTALSSRVVEANSLSTSVLEFTGSLPEPAIGYYDDQFSASNPYYPGSTAAPSAYSSIIGSSAYSDEFNSIFGTNYNSAAPAGDNVPINTPNTGQIVILGTISPTSVSDDLIKPVQVVTKGNYNFVIYTVVSWAKTASPASSNPSQSQECAYPQIDVYVYWNNFKNYTHNETLDSTPGQQPNTAATSASCTGSGTLDSSPPDSPTSVSVSLPEVPTNPPSVNITWTEQNQSSTVSPVGYYVIAWSPDSTFDTSVVTSPIEIASDTNKEINPSPNAASGTTTFTYQASQLAYDSNYYFKLYAYSQDGSVAVSPSSISYPGMGSYITTNSQPATEVGCNFSNIFGTFVPPSSGTVSGTTPMIVSKTYLNPNGTFADNLILGGTSSDGCNANQYSISIYAGDNVGVNPLVNVPLSNFYNANPLASNVNGVEYQTLALSSTSNSIVAGVYTIQLENNSGASTTTYYADPPTDSITLTGSLLVCPYVSFNNRVQASNKC